MVSQATTESESQAPNELLAQATNEAPTVQDAMLRRLKRDDVLGLPAESRLRWFYLMQCRHDELNRVTSDLLELLEPNNEVSIISVIGMTGNGKTTLASSLRTTLAEKFFGDTPLSEVPVIYVKAPANGERSLSWTTMYRRILRASNEPLIDLKRRALTDNGQMKLKVGSKTGLADLRESIENMLKNRNVRVLIIDEALHLLRFSDYSSVMDTLKSLAEIYSTKLLLIGSYDISELMQEYGQVARRGEIIHFQRYHEDVPKEVREFLRVLAVSGCDKARKYGF